MISSRYFGPSAAQQPPIPFPEGPCPRTSLRVGPHGPYDFPFHMNRLKVTAAFLGETPGWLNDVEGDLTDWLVSGSALQERALRLRLHLEAGVLYAEVGPIPSVVKPYRLHPMPHPLSSLRMDPITRHKGLCGSWSRDALHAASEAGRQDALLLWPEGTLAETAIAAVGLEIGNALLIPPPEGRVTSIAEALALPDWAAQRGLQLQQFPIPLARIKEGQLWCMNAVRGIWPATVD